MMSKKPLYAFCLAGALLGASSLQARQALSLHQTLTPAFLPQEQATLEVDLYPDRDSDQALATQTFIAGEWQLDQSGDAPRIRVTFDALPDEQSAQPLWMEMRLDGELVGRRVIVAAATTPGVTFAAGNALNMDGNKITGLATPTDNEDAANKAYVDSAFTTGSVDWNHLNNVPAGLADGDDDTLGALNCGNNQIAKWNGSAWACAADDSGWSLSGNAGTDPNNNFLGTTDGQPLIFKIHNQQALRLESDGTNPPNVIGGYSGNSVNSGVYGATIGGGGASGYTNMVTGNYGTVGGGFFNTARGDTATVGGGSSNTASTTYATVGGGYGNIASNSSATVGGGDGNTASGDTATVGGGDGNTANGDTATVGGGSSNIAIGLYTTVPGGRYAVASHYGQLAYANGRFAATGDAQFSLYVLRNTTTDNTTRTPLYLDGSSTELTIEDGHTMAVEILIVGRDQNNGDSAGYNYSGVIKNVGGTLSFAGTTAAVATIGEDQDGNAWIDPSSGFLRIEVRGFSNNAIRWVAVVRAAEVAW